MHNYYLILILSNTFSFFFGLQNYIELDSTDNETDCEDTTDCSSLISLISQQTMPQNNKTNDIKDEHIPLTNNEYLKLVFSNEYTAKDLLTKHASQYWWINKSENIVNGGKNSPHFALKR